MDLVVVVRNPAAIFIAALIGSVVLSSLWSASGVDLSQRYSDPAAREAYRQYQRRLRALVIPVGIPAVVVSLAVGIFLALR